MMRVLVIGDRLEALIAAWVLRQHPHFDVWLVAERTPGIDAEDRLLSHTESLGNLLRALDVMYSSFSPHDGILLRGRIETFPRDLARLERDDAQRVLEDLRQKSGEVFKFNGSFKRKHPRRIRVNVSELAKALIEHAKVIVSPHWALEPGALHANGSKKFEYDFAIYTTPLWTSAHRVWFKLPDARAVTKTIAEVEPRKLSHFRRWDTVLAPYTPASAAYRVINVGGDACRVEFRESADTATLLSELNFLFPDGYALKQLRSSPGALLPIAERIAWPENVVPLGSAAEWRPEVAVEDVLDAAYVLMRRWTR